MSCFVPCGDGAFDVVSILLNGLKCMEINKLASLSLSSNCSSLQFCSVDHFVIQIEEERNC
jgi:hypothetical protein